MTTHAIESGGATLHVEETGAGPAVVCAHALLCDGRMFDGVVPSLARDHRVLVVDARGHGRSPPPPGPYTIGDEADDLLRVMDALGEARAVLLGSSMGGMAALNAALRAPARVRGLILLDTEARRAPLRNRLGRWCLGLAVRALGVGPVVGRLATRPMFGPSFTRERPDVVAAFADRVAAMDPGALLLAMRAVDERPSVLERCAEVAAPVLLVFGAEDDYTPLDGGRRMLLRFPRARLEVVPRAGHSAVTERPEAVAALLRAFLTALPA